MKYRGADGWMNDDGVTRRYKNKDDTKPAPKASEPVEPKSNKPNLDKCPNCTFSIMWKRVEAHCDHCGWGKKDGDWDGYVPPPKSPLDSGDGALACCGFLGLSIIACLVGMGMGYGVGGWAGLIVGLGIGAAVPVGLIFVMNAATSKKEKDA